MKKLNSELSELKGLQRQTFFLTISYFVFNILDIMFMSISNILYTNNFICVEENNVRATDNLGSSLMLFMALSILLFSLMMWYIFYKIPERSGLISKAKAKTRLILNDNSVSGTHEFMQEVMSIEDSYEHLI